MERLMYSSPLGGLKPSEGGRVYFTNVAVYSPTQLTFTFIFL
jgi:hypothetical protein